MKKYNRLLLYGFLGLFLVGMVPVDRAVSQDRNKTQSSFRKNIQFQRAFLQKRPPVENSLIRPSEKRKQVPDKHYRQNKARDALNSGRIVSLSVIRKRIKQSFPGKIVDVRLLEPKRKNRPYIYKVKVLRKDGKLLELKIDAATARIVSVKGNG